MSCTLYIYNKEQLTTPDQKAWMSLTTECKSVSLKNLLVKYQAFSILNYWHALVDVQGEWFKMFINIFFATIGNKISWDTLP